MRGEAFVGEYLIESLMQLSRSILKRLGPRMERRDDDKALSSQRGNKIAERQGASATTIAM
ncbi:hypothetical protein EAS56_33085 [Bradyrhizobium guangzhouense]|uniref:Uncharacterized protein n=1 Tax=Bradyrhizobium guangzhouense TaxID=1325095 RepID=A0AAE5WY55_9BRAD|nr:hypothetical protein XH91_08040 [Bradyrhizobium guangzhouense]RXH07321.1 hypothetical protein EAS56_33085 [Bradyrhizobium guangzhouense]